MPQRKALTTVVLVALACGALTGCESAAEAGTAGQRVDGGEIVFATDREPTCLDPHNSGDMPQTYIARQYLDSLVSMQEDGSIVPWLADSWTISDDGLHYDFRLKEGVSFTDGEPFDAEAVVANFEQILDPATQSSTALLYLTSYFTEAVALDEHTVRISLERPYAPLLQALSQAFFGIESPRAMARGLEENCESPVGTGPFIVESWNRQQDVQLVRNENYTSWPADARHEGPAYLERVTWRFLKDNTTRYNALASGEVDAIFNLPAESQTLAENNPDIELQEFVHSGTPWGIDFNTTRPFTGDRRVRQAFAFASNAKASVESAYAGVYPYEGNVVSSGTPYYNADYTDPYPHDTARAGALLDEAGWSERDADGYRVKDGQRLTLRLPYNADAGETPPADVTVLQNVQASVKEVGIDLQLDALDGSAMDAVHGDKEAYDLIPNYWNSPTPHVIYIKYSKATYDIDNGQNTAYEYNTELDETLLGAAAATEEDEQARLYDSAQRIANEQVWKIGFYPIQTRLGVSTKLKDVWIEPSEGEPVLGDAYLVH